MIGEIGSRIQTKGQPTGQIPSQANHLDKTTSSAQVSWIHKDLNLLHCNEHALQEKIIQLYDAIEKKTINNIEAKKANDILRAQLETYLSIINRIQSETKRAQENGRNSATTATKDVQPIDMNTSNDSKIIKDSTPEWIEPEPSPTVTREDTTRKNRKVGISRSNRGVEIQPFQYKSDESEADVEQEYKFAFKLQPKNKMFNGLSSIDSIKKTTYNSSISLLCSPRISMQQRAKKPENKTFLKRVNQNQNQNPSMNVSSNNSTSNHATNRYKSVDIESLWNQIQSPSGAHRNKITKQGGFKDRQRNHYF